MRRMIRRLVGFGLLAAGAYAVWRALAADRATFDRERRSPLARPGDAAGRPPFHVPPGVEVGGGPETEAPAKPLVEGTSDS